MKIRHIILASLVSAIWGFSFIAVSIGLRGCPPLLLAAMRFLIVFLLGAVFSRRPALPAALYCRAGLCLGVVQFGCMFSAIRLGVPAGIVSVIAQLQVFMTLLLSSVVLRERSSTLQKCMMALALLGISMLAYVRFAAALPIAPLMLAVLGAAGFAWGNIELKRAGKVDMFAFTIWMSAVPPIPLLLLSVVSEGGLVALTHAIRSLTWSSVLALLFLSILGTLFSLGTWAKLMTLYPTSVVAPFYLISPVFGIFGGWIVLGERYDALSITSAGLIIVALVGNTYGAKLIQYHTSSDKVTENI
ncbi:EamA family transporter [Robbsia andropogonis]|uniref:EamA family transporter n=1 Tax=Robbsia andropogonis TaxID=28092 RepID=UPI002A6B09D0|nr:EamA family transporter [Robbsia andropogonis]